MRPAEPTGAKGGIVMLSSLSSPLAAAAVVVCLGAGPAVAEEAPQPRPSIAEKTEAIYRKVIDT